MQNVTFLCVYLAFMVSLFNFLAPSTYSNGFPFISFTFLFICVFSCFCISLLFVKQCSA